MKESLTMLRDLVLRRKNDAATVIDDLESLGHGEGADFFRVKLQIYNELCADLQQVIDAQANEVRYGT